MALASVGMMGFALQFQHRNLSPKILLTCSHFQGRSDKGLPRYEWRFKVVIATALTGYLALLAAVYESGTKPAVGGLRKRIGDENFG